LYRRAFTTSDQACFANRVPLHFIRPGKLVENAIVESFNGRLRDECLNAHWFADLDHARRVIAAWCNEYNDARPHSSLDGRTPSEYERDFNRLTQSVA
jgi:putative transposase